MTAMPIRTAKLQSIESRRAETIRLEAEHTAAEASLEELQATLAQLRAAFRSR